MSGLAEKRLLIISHGHPDLNKGGAEMAAYNMFTECLGRGEDVYFVSYDYGRRFFVF